MAEHTITDVVGTNGSLDIDGNTTVDEVFTWMNLPHDMPTETRDEVRRVIEGMLDRLGGRFWDGYGEEYLGVRVTRRNLD